MLVSSFAWSALVRSTAGLSAFVLLAAVARRLVVGRWTGVPRAATAAGAAVLVLTLAVAAIDRGYAHAVLVISDGPADEIAVAPMVYVGDLNGAFPQVIVSSACQVGRSQPVLWTINTTSHAVRSETVIYGGDSGARRTAEPETFLIPPGSAAPFREAAHVLAGHPPPRDHDAGYNGYTCDHWLSKSV